MSKVTGISRREALMRARNGTCGSGGGIRDWLNSAQPTMKPMNNPASMMPGKTPAMNSRAIDWSVAVA